MNGKLFLLVVFVPALVFSAGPPASGGNGTNSTGGSGGWGGSSGGFCPPPLMAVTTHVDSKLMLFMGTTPCSLTCTALHGPDIMSAKARDAIKGLTITICTLGLILSTFFFYNVLTRFYRKRSLRNVSLLIDAPIIIVFCLGMVVWMELGTYMDDKIGCHDDGTIASNNPKGGHSSCTFQGVVSYMAGIAIVLYNMVLAFALWRYVQNPKEPLFNVSKWLVHLVAVAIIVGLTAGVAGENIIGGSPITGACSVSKTKEDISPKYTIIPQAVFIALTVVFVALSAWKLKAATPGMPDRQFHLRLWVYSVALLLLGLGTFVGAINSYKNREETVTARKNYMTCKGGQLRNPAMSCVLAFPAGVLLISPILTFLSLIAGVMLSLALPELGAKTLQRLTGRKSVAFSISVEDLEEAQPVVRVQNDEEGPTSPLVLSHEDDVLTPRESPMNIASAPEAEGPNDGAPAMSFTI